MRRLLPFPIALLLVLTASATAHAGGFATVGLSSTPDGVAPGRPWHVELTVLQHGRTPLEGLAPRVRIRSTGAWREFAAKPAGEPGVYRAAVVFPKAGSWEYQVLDGFNDQMPHAFPAVRIGAPAPAVPSPAPAPPAPAPADDGIAAGWLWGAGAALLAALALLAADRRRRRRPRAVPGAPEPA